MTHLWGHINKMMELGIHKLNIATEPVSISEIYQMLRGEVFENLVATIPPLYDYRTKYSKEFGGADGYIYSKEQVLREIRDFVRENGGRV